MAKKYSIKFWIVFWSISTLFLIGWFLFWQIRNNGIGKIINSILDVAPIEEEMRSDYKAVAAIAEYFLKRDNVERTFLVLLENNMEIRPGGGFIGAFGILKIKNGNVVSIETHDLSNFDGRIPEGIEPPYPMKETLGIKSWKLRDSNFSPDFTTNAKKAEEFYYLGKGEEKFDGVVGITANMLTSLLEVTGPIQMEGYPGTYDSENAILSLEYQVEKAYAEQGIAKGDRKSVMNELAKQIMGRLSGLSYAQKLQLAKVSLKDLNAKDIQLFFKDARLEEIARSAGWTGNVDQSWKDDFLFVVDANLGAFKSDYYVKRSIDYFVDLTKEVPTATLKITYTHTAKQKDWMTRDYLSYLRVYVPEGSWLGEQKNFEGARFGQELEKKYFGSIVKVPIGETKTVELNYALPKDISSSYDLKIQKQAGLNGVPVSITIKDKDGTREFSKILERDILLSEITAQ